MCRMPLESSRGINVWPVERPELILIQAMLSLGMNALLNQGRKNKSNWWTENYQDEKGIYLLQGKAGKGNTVFQKSCCWWHWKGAPGGYPLCLCLFVSFSSPAVVEALIDRAVLRAAAATAATADFFRYRSSLCSNKSLVCHSSLLQCIRFILPLAHILPPPFYPPPSLLTLLRSLVLHHMWGEILGA